MRRAGVYILASLVSGVSAALILASGPSYTETRSPQGTAYNVKRGHSTYNECRDRPCQIAHLNSVDDFCLWAPPQPVLSAARNTEHTLVAWCTKSAHGTHLIPDGTISGARLVITPAYVQITGVGNFTNINVPTDGVASANGEGDRLHDLVFTRAYGQLEQIYDWTSFVSQERFCFRACKPSATASTTCPWIYDSFGCSEDAPGSYDTGVFEDCVRDAIEVPLTLHQEVLAAPSHYSIRPSSACTTRGAINNAQAARARRAVLSTSGSTSSTPVAPSSHLPFRSHGQSAPLTSSVTPTTTDTATTITFPSFPASALTTNSFISSGSPASSTTSASTPYTYTYSRWHSLTHRRSRHYSSTSSASVSTSSHRLFTYSRSSSSAASSPSLLGDPSTMSSTSPPASSTLSFTPASSTSSSSDASSSATSTSTSTPTLSSTSTSPFPSSSGGASSSLSSLSSAQPSSSTPSSIATPTSSLTSPFVTSPISSQNSEVLTLTSLSSSSVSTTPSATSSTTFPNSQTQLGSQCPPVSQVAVNAGYVVPSPTPLLPLILTILMIVISSSIGVLIL